MNTSIFRSLILCILFAFLSCLDENHRDRQPSVTITKWFNNHAGVISLTYDSGGPLRKSDIEAQQHILDRNMVLDYELVTDSIRPNKLEYILGTMIPAGFQFFGHGHSHICHDGVTYEEALQSFILNYVTMKGLGIEPIAYAYPQGCGNKGSTRLALKTSGFLCGRMHSKTDRQNPYIMPGKRIKPEDWYHLPSLVMQAYEFANAGLAINDSDELIPFLDKTIQKKAWLITTYHNIGYEEGWGYYYMSEFVKDLEAIRSRDFWVASMNDVILYTLERNNVTLFSEYISNSYGIVQKLEILLSDELPDEKYDHPLTIIFEVPDEWLGKSLGVFQNDRLITELLCNHEDRLISLRPDENLYILKSLTSEPPSN